MQLTKKQEADLMHVYNTWWNSYLTGDVATYDSFLHDEYHFVGSTNGEEYLNRKDTTAFFEATAHQLAGKAELRNLKRTLEELDGGEILITDVADAYVISEPEWVFYSRFRFSSIMKETKEGWRFIYQHFSAPDTKAQEGETLGTKQITKENQELRDAIKRRTVELEQKTKVLALEAALERVRSRTMGMHKSEELKDVIKVVYEQFVHLNIHVEHAGFIIDYKERDDMHIWLADMHTIPFQVTLPYFDCAHWNSFREAKEKGLDFFANHLSFEEKNKFYRDLFEFVPGVPEETLQYYLSCPGLAISTVLLEDIGLYIENFSGIPYTDEENATLMRFGKVFQQTYTRFLDLQKAEAQAREAQVEAGLERVRSRSLAMHKSEELPEVIQLVFEQLKQLNFNIDSAQFDVNFRESDDLNMWTAIPGEPYPTRQHIPYFNNAVVNSVKNAKEAGLTLSAHNFTFEEKNEFFNHFFKHTSVPEERREFILSLPGWARSVVYLDRIYLGIQNYSGILYSEAEHTILGRFAKVFEQTYTRFLDLQKAEAQAREAQIELGLERVRARAMAMQNSDDLKELIGTVFTELTKLDLALTRCIIWVFEPASNAARWWMANSEEPSSPMSFYIKYHKHPAYLTFVQEWKKQNAKFVYDLAGDDKISWDNILFNETELKQLPDIVKDGMRAPERVLLSASFNNFGGINVASLERLSDEHFDILLRFAKVFDLTYTRFNDLQKAEAQAREAQIETALERVRSASMAMHKSEELHKIIQVVATQISDIGIIFDAVSFVSVNDDDSWETWIASNAQNYYPIQIHVPYFDHLLMRKNEDDFSTFVLDFDEKNSFFNHFFENTVAKNTPEERKKLVLESKGMAASSLRAKLRLSFYTYDVIPYKHSDNEIFKRFGKVFDQAYTRFLDLQKAEAQAREAQIEAALERVRSRSLAMHKSEELEEVILVVSEQLQQLQFKFHSVSFGFDTEQLGLNFWLASPQLSKSFLIKVPYIDSPSFNRPVQTRKNGGDFYTDVLSREENLQFLQHLFDYSDLSQIPAERKSFLLSTPGFARSISLMKNTILTVGNYFPTPYSQEQNAILKRFGNVFEQAYVRFLDLQKAEAQAREAQIEAALERVRSRTMAMHNSSELIATAEVIFEQIKQLGAESLGVAFAICEPDDIMVKKWTNIGIFSIPYTDEEGEQKMYEAWKNQAELHEEIYEGERIQKYYELFLKFPAFKEGFDKHVANGYTLPSWQKNHAAIFKYGYLLFITTKLFEETNIFVRFAKVFEQTYTRFLDLQKAEAQAREAKIEAALERVRAVAMSMMKSDELLTICQSVFTQVQVLGFENIRAAQIYIRNDEEEKFMNYDYAGDTGAVKVEVNYNSHPNTRRIYDVIRNAGDGLVYNVIEKEKLDEWRAYLYNTLGQQPEESLNAADGLHYYLYSFGLGAFGICTFKAISSEELDILMRFRNVFNLSYQRYADIALAEAQLREAQVEAALERVRARTMAMQRSEELLDVATVLFQQVKTLGVPLWNCGFNIWEIGEKEFIYYPGTPDGIIAQSPCKIPLTEHPVFQQFDVSRRRGDELMIFEKEGEMQRDHYQYMLSLPGVGDLLQSMLNAGFEFPSFQIDHVANFAFGNLIFITYEHFPEMHGVFKRFAKVFEQTYTRFLDLQKAEAQTKEAKIEAALEKVRSRTMAMQSSDELPEVANLLFTEVRALGIHAWSCGYNILAEDKKTATCCMSSEGTLQTPFQLRLWGEASFDEMGEFIQSDKNMLVQELGGKAIEEHYAYMKSFPDLKPTFDEIDRLGLSLPSYQINHLCKFTQGFILFITYEKVPDAHDVFRRFTNVFDQTYTRFLDLQKAEAQATEAIKRASVDRVRAEIASMRTTGDLERIQPLIWNELKILGVPFIRCGVFIMDEEKQEVNTLLSTPDGKAIAAFRLPYYSTQQSTQIVTHWQQKLLFKDHMDEAAFAEYTQNLVQLGVVPRDEKYVTENLPTDLYLHFLPFMQGMLYAGNTAPLSNDELQLVQNLADAFSTAYARYEDFNKLESAKKQVDNTLNELQLTQKQLIQSEKMASLGELTAGIAHEIQNPLNFVNNFSEVSKELMDEMKEALIKGDLDEAREIMNDVIGNLEKINHHGKRADGIVKGMLQHSRSSSGIKESTDINALCDEYLRLAYHGLKARDKSFNASFHFEADNSLPKLDVVPEDIGRVLLNLINNAFQAVSERVKRETANVKGDSSSVSPFTFQFEPLVTLSTKKLGDRIEISVKDNGPGIPDAIKDKIFQPFFTTKPTGQGTGLGLSLSYDIVKAHGGEFRMETKEGEGSEFSILLPIV